VNKFDEILNKGQGLSYWLLFAASAVAFYGGLWLLMILTYTIGGLDHETFTKQNNKRTRLILNLSPFCAVYVTLSKTKESLLGEQAPNLLVTNY
jgi:glycopeptide antibiotics resistance protein